VKLLLGTGFASVAYYPQGVAQGVAQGKISGIQYLYIGTVEGWKMHKTKREQSIKLLNTPPTLF